MASRKPLKGIKKKPAALAPQTEKDKAFCARWLFHFDVGRAWREAGFSTATAGTRALAKLEKFADYLRPIRDAKAKLVAERIMVSSQDVLDGMVKRVFFDPTTFFERTEKPLTELVKAKGQQEKVEQVVMWDGRPVYGERMKPYSDLTPEQRAVVEITSAGGERISYRLPSIREQHIYLTSLGRQYGMFAEKLILERHNHQHTHHHMTFENVPSAKLVSLTRQILPMVGLEFAQQLGYTAEEVEQAAKAEGVLMPEKVTG